jgi:hypothetical protein
MAKTLTLVATPDPDRSPAKKSRARQATHKLIEIPDYEFVECRAMGHAWRHRKNAVGMDDPSGQFVPPRFSRPLGIGTGMIGKVSQCATCKGVRVKWITRSGEVLNRYYMPDNYSRTGEEYKPTMREWRSTYVAGVFADFTHTEGSA